MDDFGISVQVAQEEGVRITTLEPGTLITVETLNSVYQIKVINQPEISITGGLRSDGSVRFPAPTPGIIIGANWGTRLKLGQICHGMRLAIDLGDHTIETSPVKEVKLDGLDWHYSMGWNKEPQT